MRFISMSLVRAVEAVKNQLFILFGNTTSGIGDRKAWKCFMKGKGKVDCSVRGGIGKGIV